VGIGRRAAATLAGFVLAVTACSGSAKGGGAVPSTGPTLPPAGVVPVPSLPASVPPGTGLFVLGDEQIPLTVASCSLSPEAVASVLEVQLAVNLTGAGGATLTVTSVQAVDVGGGKASSTTESVTFRRGAETAAAQRIAIAGTYRDPNDPHASGALLNVDATTVSGGGLFAIAGTAPGTPSLRPGAWKVTCK
jgi:hypothetical protein